MKPAWCKRTKQAFLSEDSFNEAANRHYLPRTHRFIGRQRQRLVALMVVPYSPDLVEISRFAFARRAEWIMGINKKRVGWHQLQC